MNHSTRVPRGTAAEELDRLVADHARVSAHLDQALAALRNTEHYRDRIVELARALDLAQDDHATVMPITQLRRLIGFRHRCRYSPGVHE